MKVKHHHFHLFISLLVKRIEKPEPRFNEWKNVSFSLGKTTVIWQKEWRKGHWRERLCKLFHIHVSYSYIGMKDTMLCPKSSLLSPLDHRRSTRLHKKV